MAFDERLWFLLMGMAIGFVLGRITRLDKNVQDMKEELDEVDEIVKEQRKDKRKLDESGFIKISGVSGVALFLVIVVTVGAAFLSQKASHDAQNTQGRLNRVNVCTATFLSKTIVALNERTTYTGQQADSNVDLQTSQAKFFNLLLHRPPYSEHRRFRAAQNYQSSLNEFLHVSKKARVKQKNNPFPTEDELHRCLAVAVK